MRKLTTLEEAKIETLVAAIDIQARRMMRDMLQSREVPLTKDEAIYTRDSVLQFGVRLVDELPKEFVQIPLIRCDKARGENYD